MKKNGATYVENQQKHVGSKIHELLPDSLPVYETSDFPQGQPHPKQGV